MSDDIHIRPEGRAGRITLNRPKALNALTLPMIEAIRAALAAWVLDDSVDVIVIDAAGPRAFCAGGDLTALYEAGRKGDFAAGQAFWASEYRMNLALATCAKPVVTLLHGFVMGGGVGLGCHAALRLADPDASFALPEAKIGLVPDAGGSFLLALTPGRMGEYLAATGLRFSAADAVWLGFADRLIGQEEWPALIAHLAETGDLSTLPAGEPPHAPLAARLDDVNRHFGGETLGDIQRSLLAEDSDFAAQTLDQLQEVSPLAATCAVEMLHRLGDAPPLIRALDLEYRFAHRAQPEGDLLEGIRAMVIDKDRRPDWRHRGVDEVTSAEVARMLMPLGPHRLNFGGVA